MGSKRKAVAKIPKAHYRKVGRIKSRQAKRRKRG